MKDMSGFLALVVLLSFGLMSPLAFAGEGKDKDKDKGGQVVIYGEEEKDKDNGGK